MFNRDRLGSGEKVLLGVLVAAFAALVIRNAWLSDDAYIIWEINVFRFEDDGGLTVALPGKGFHNAEAPQGYWFHENIDAVMRVIPE